ncbi:hypothetical protein EJV47_06575 [Hymenobacter gummosus]|uniref:Uncharacterized protein n=1 Tax=Hymenobacter gummosus TaxID=1776032 RepID=A0A431U5Z9_9BACT|nr:hypothetical protein [Hymenobacter gummosus]RTQ51463.1 hypothetical protein EJV47_06575 [Hymenobacter gummosus]
MRRVKYSHQRATEMYTQGHPPADVAQMLVEEGATPEEAPGLARHYFRNFLLYQMDEQRRRSQSAETQKLGGGLLLAAGVVASLLAYLLMDHVFLLFYGAILGGGHHAHSGPYGAERSRQHHQSAHRAAPPGHRRACPRPAMTSAEYWQKLPPFEYVTTYSFNRGSALQEQLRANEQLIEATKQELATARYMRQAALHRQLAELEQAGEYIALLTPAGSISPLACPIAQSNRHPGLVERLGAILTAPVKLHMVSGCRPIYRDALVFHDAAGRIVSVLNICFQCLYLQAVNGKFLEVDVATYEQLRQLLQSLGHPISDDYED